MLRTDLRLLFKMPSAIFLESTSDPLTMIRASVDFVLAFGNSVESMGVTLEVTMGVQIRSAPGAVLVSKWLANDCQWLVLSNKVSHKPPLCKLIN